MGMIFGGWAQDAEDAIRYAEPDRLWLEEHRAEVAARRADHQAWLQKGGGRDEPLGFNKRFEELISKYDKFLSLRRLNAV